MLKDALVGNTFAITLVTASPFSQTLTETLKCVEFGEELRRVKKNPSSMQSNVLVNSDMNTEQLKSMYMGAQSEVLVWRQLVDSLIQKSSTLEKALSKEKQNTQLLTLALQQEIEESTQHERKCENSPGDVKKPQMPSPGGDGPLEDADEIDLSEMKDVLSIFDEGDRVIACKHGRGVSKYASKSEDDSSHSFDSEYTRTFESEREPDGVSKKRMSSMRSCSSRGSRANGVKKLNKFMESMTTSVGALSMDELLEGSEESLPEESPLAIKKKILNMIQEQLADVEEVDVEAFHFTAEVEKSFPKMNTLRGRRPVRETHLHSLTQHEKGHIKFTK